MSDERNNLDFKIPKDWQIGQFSKDLKIQGRIGWKGYKTSDLVEEGPIVIGGTEIKSSIQLSLSNVKHLSREKYEESPEIKLKDGDVLLVTRGNLGEVGYYHSDYGEGTINPSVIILKEFNGNSKFLFYYLISTVGKKQVLSLTSGSSIPAIYQSEVYKLNYPKPPLKEQKSIADILSAFDNKIELLHAQNKTLEELAQTIFMEWFGKYQNGDELPNGWGTYELNELVDTVNGYSYKGNELVEESLDALVTLKSFDRNGGFQTRGFKPFSGNPKPSQEVKIGDLVVAHTDLTQDAEVLGNPAFIFDDGGFKRMFITMDLVKVISKNINVSSSFLYYLMKDRAFKGHCVGYSNGTTVLHLSKKAIPEYIIYLPKDFNRVKEFSEISNSTTNKISLNKDKIKILTQTRDTLLQKLMSGEIRVKDFNL